MTTMDQDTEDFLASLLFDADSPDDDKREFRDATIYDFSDQFRDAVTGFLRGFREFLDANGFPARHFKKMERTFGCNCYWSLSGSGCGFFDDSNHVISCDLSDWLDLYSCNHYRFHELSSSLYWHGRGGKRRIDLDRKKKFLDEARTKLFSVTYAEQLNQLRLAALRLTLACEVYNTLPEVGPQLAMNERISTARKGIDKIINLKRPLSTK